MTTHSYYAAYKLLTKEGKSTDLHTTIMFRHDTNEETLRKITNELKNLNLKNKLVRVTGNKYLDGPNGEPNMIKTCLLDLLNEDFSQDEKGLVKLNELCKKFTYRRYLKKQHPFTFHTSIGNKNSNNQKTLDDIFILGDLYIKNMDTKQKIIL